MVSPAQVSTGGDKGDRLPAPLGEILGGYRLDTVLGRGSMGTVYAATHARLGRRAAVKVLRNQFARDPAFVSRFFDEARVVNEIRHPNLVDIFDYVETIEPFRVACVMELIDGPTLRQALYGEGLRPIQALNIAIQLCDALEAVHSIGVVHRDLKPANVLVTGGLDTDLSRVPSIKVLDFGVAKLANPSQQGRTAVGVVLGTPAYMAPEQLGGGQVTGAADVYSIGALLFEMLAGRKLFDQDHMALIERKLEGDVFVELPADLPLRSELTALIQETIVRQPAGRISIQGLRARLAELAAELAREPTGDLPLKRPSRPPSKPDHEVDVTARLLAQAPTTLEGASVQIRSGPRWGALVSALAATALAIGVASLLHSMGDGAGPDATPAIPHADAGGEAAGALAESTTTPSVPELAVADAGPAPPDAGAEPPDATPRDAASAPRADAGGPRSGRPSPRPSGARQPDSGETVIPPEDMKPW